MEYEKVKLPDYIRTDDDEFEMDKKKCYKSCTKKDLKNDVELNESVHNWAYHRSKGHKYLSMAVHFEF